MRIIDELPNWAPMLYVPGDRPDLADAISGKKLRGVCSLAICLEDAVRKCNRSAAASTLCKILQEVTVLPRPVFIRPANFEALDWVLDQSGVERVTGFILPKATTATIHSWVERSQGLFRLFPIMESREALDPLGRRDLAQACATHRSIIPAVRIGANDLFSLLGGLRRPSRKTIYETPVGAVIDGLIQAFSFHEIRLCGSVFDRLEDRETLAREVEADIERGLFSKTAVTPDQAQQIWRHYRPDEAEIEEARAIISSDALAVFKSLGKMVEPACHAGWAKRLLDRNRIFNSAEDVLKVDRKAQDTVEAF